MNTQRHSECIYSCTRITLILSLIVLIRHVLLCPTHSSPIMLHSSCVTHLCGGQVFTPIVAPHDDDTVILQRHRGEPCPLALHILRQRAPLERVRQRPVLPHRQVKDLAALAIPPPEYDDSISAKCYRGAVVALELQRGQRDPPLKNGRGGNAPERGKMVRGQ